MQNLFNGHSRHPLVEAIVYRRDPQTQFRDLKEFVSFTKGLATKPDKPTNRKRTFSIVEEYLIIYQSYTSPVPVCTSHRLFLYYPYNSPI